MTDKLTHRDALTAIREQLATAQSTGYTSAMSEAGNEYHARFKYAHPLPAQWRWSELFEAMMAAAPQSPVAPADERENAIKAVVGMCNRISGSTTWNAAEYMYDRLANAPKTAQENFVTLQSLLRALQDAHVRVSGSAAYGWKIKIDSADAPAVSVQPVAWRYYPKDGLKHAAYTERESQAFSYDDNPTPLYLSAPTPPTSAADARMPTGDELRAIVRANRSDGSDPTPPAQYVAAGWRAAIAATGKGQS